jgi:Flp pilus assembly protein TadG
MMLHFRAGDGTQQSDRGSLTLFTVVIAFALFLLGGLVVDGGEKLTAARRASDVAEQAARAGAQAVSVTSLRNSGRLALDPAAAQAAARAYLKNSGEQGLVRVDGDVITVTTTVSRPTVILGLVGIGQVSATGTGSARPLSGISTGYAP